MSEAHPEAQPNVGSNIEVKVRKGEPVEKALRRLKKVLEREEVIMQARRKRHFEKPSDVKQRKKKELAFQDMLRNRHADR